MRAAAAVAIGAAGVQATPVAYTTANDIYVMTTFASAEECTAGAIKSTTQVSLGTWTASNDGSTTYVSDGVSSVCPDAACATGATAVPGKASLADTDNCSTATVTIAAGTTEVGTKMDGECAGMKYGAAFTITGTMSTKKSQLKCGSVAPTGYGIALAYSTDCTKANFKPLLSRVFKVRTATAADNVSPTPAEYHAGADSLQVVNTCFGGAGKQWAVTKCVEGEKVEERWFTNNAECLAGTAAGTLVSTTTDETANTIGTELRLAGLTAGKCDTVTDYDNAATSDSAARKMVVICPAPANAVRGSAAAAFAAAAAWLLF